MSDTDRVDVPMRWAWAEIDVLAIAHNVRALRTAAAPAEVAVVVKADGYGHGAVTVARAALAAGATRLCVALVSEGVVLREAGIDAPVLVLSEQPPDAAAALVAHDLTATVSSPAGIDALAAVARPGTPVHLKVDTGMHRVGVAPEAAGELVARIAGHAPHLVLAGVFTHLAVADEPADPATAAQLARFDAALAELESALPPDVVIHTANSAGAFAHPSARRQIVRSGITTYGISPGPGVDDLVTGLQPAMALKARVSYVKRLRAGDRISYGLRHTFERDATVATVPIGYADGVRRNLSPGQEVLIGGCRRPIVGVITMDQLMVSCDDDVAVGDEVVLLGAQGDERIRAEEWADRLGTIGYEVVCGIGARVPRVTVGGSVDEVGDGAAVSVS